MAGDQDRSDEELGRTATAPGSEPRSVAEAPPLTGELGRYRLQRELGRGGMGVVHAAFDPDLERKVALKVLRQMLDGGEARQRLLREARAMARVTHPNVVTVHEVGSTGGRDYIAMELIDGSTLEDWLTAEPRSEREIIQSYVAAGRGLAAAHAAGLVHRDFKPRNVLRHKDGRIVVTDFGLVVGVDAAPVDPLTVTQRMANATATGDTSPSSLSGLTATGSLLGTPAYMAPEQWTGGSVGPRADQFAFCVALWESLTRERPYVGKTLDELKEQVCTGKRIDDGKLPRRLRKILARGLDPVPEKRWPSMDALLAAIGRSERRPGVAIAIGGAAIAVGAVTLFAVGREHAGPACDPPALDPKAVWSTSQADAMRAHDQPLAAVAIERDFNAWQQAYARACKTPAGTREPALACLDGVIGRLDLVKQAVLAVKTDDPVEVGGMLVDPAVCETVRPPRLVNAHSNELRSIFTTQIERSESKKKLTEAEADQIVSAANAEPCASAYARMQAAGARTGTARLREIDEAERAAQRCGDDRIITEVALYAADVAVGLAGADGRAKLKRAEALVERVAQPDLEGQLELLRAWVAIIADQLDEGVTRFDKSADLYMKRGMFRAALSTHIASIRIRRARGAPEDLARIPAMLEEDRRQAVERVAEKDHLVRAIDWQRADWLWSTGDIEGADAMRQKLLEVVPVDKPRVVRGHVVDEQGAPVAGAEVMAGGLQGDGLHASIPSGDIRTTRTAADGRFEISDADSEGEVIAQLGDRRSPPQRVGDEVTLKLAPTSRITGTVDLHGQAFAAVTVTASDKLVPTELNYVVAAPVRRDGTFTIDGVPRGHIRLQTVREGILGTSVNPTEIVVDKPVIEHVSLDVKASSRSLRMLVRSVYNVGLSNAQVFVLPGKHTSSTLREIAANQELLQLKLAVPIQNEQASPAVHARSKPGDLYSLVTQVPDGEISACAMPLPEHLDDPDLEKISSNPERMEKVQVTCVPVGPKDDVVIVEVQPWPRFD